MIARVYPELHVFAEATVVSDLALAGSASTTRHEQARDDDDVEAYRTTDHAGLIVSRLLSWVNRPEVEPEHQPACCWSA